MKSYEEILCRLELLVSQKNQMMDETDGAFILTNSHSIMAIQGEIKALAWVLCKESKLEDFDLNPQANSRAIRAVK